jgi:hypothetical protein
LFGHISRQFAPVNHHDLCRLSCHASVVEKADGLSKSNWLWGGQCKTMEGFLCMMTLVASNIVHA